MNYVPRARKCKLPSLPPRRKYNADHETMWYTCARTLIKTFLTTATCINSTTLLFHQSPSLTTRHASTLPSPLTCSLFTRAWYSFRLWLPAPPPGGMTTVCCRDDVCSTQTSGTVMGPLHTWRNHSVHYSWQRHDGGGKGGSVAPSWSLTISCLLQCYL